MIGISLSDLHLGKTASGRPIGGRNGREVDVERALEHATEIIIREQPDLVTVAGDCFDVTAWRGHAVKAFQRFVQAIINEARAHIVIIGGNHESPRTANALSPNTVVDGEPSVYVVTESKRLVLNLDNGERVAIACFPFNALAPDRVDEIEPDPTADVNIALVHAALRSSANPNAVSFQYAEKAVLDLAAPRPGGKDKRPIAEAFDVVAAGDYHEFARLHPTALAFYSGSIERTSSNIWQEHAPKGVVRYDTQARTMELIEIPTRPMFDYDFDDIPGRGDLGVGDQVEVVNAVLQMIAANPKHQDALVRFRVDGFDRADRDKLNWKLVRELKSSCFLFHFDLRMSDRQVVHLGDRRERGVRSFGDDAREFFSTDPVAVQQCAFRHLGLEVAA